MRYGFLLSGEFPDLASLEVLNLLQSYPGFRIVAEEPRILIVEAKPLGEEFFSRLAMTRESFIHLESLDGGELEEELEEELEAAVSLISGRFKGKRVCVRVKKIKKDRKLSSVDLEKKLGAIFWKNGAKIDLKNPEVVVRVYISNHCHVGILNHVTDTKQFLDRRPDKKPFFRPGALKPRFGRALVNLTGIKDGILLDPMCGTGTMIIEAGLMGVEFCGIEAFRKIAFGCAENLRHYGLERNVMLGDVRRIPLADESISGVVTDYPYLRSSKSFGELENLYEKSLSEIWRVLKDGARAVLVSNRDIDELLKDLRFEIEAKLRQEVHRSLSRKIYVVKKSNF